MKYRSKVVEIEAIQWTGKNCFEILKFMNRAPDIWEADLNETDCPAIHTRLGVIYPSLYSWVFKDSGGDFSVLSNNQFASLYEPIEDCQITGAEGLGK